MMVMVKKVEVMTRMMNPMMTRTRNLPITTTMNLAAIELSASSEVRFCFKGSYFIGLGLYMSINCLNID